MSSQVEVTPAEASRRTYRRWFEEVVSRGDLALADELLAPGYRLHFPGMPQPLDAEAHKGLVLMFGAAFPDWDETVDDLIAEGDKVVIRVTGRGTHEGDAAHRCHPGSVSGHPSPRARTDESSARRRSILP